MSSGRSRSGGISSVMVLMRKKRSSRILRDGPSSERIGRADQPEVGADHARAADRPEFPLLQQAQQLDLQLRRHLADLVEQQRTAARQLHQPDLVGNRAGERALLVAEQLRLHELGRDGGAVDLDERAARALAVLVNGAGHQLLARPALAVNQHVRIGGRDQAHQLKQPSHPRAGRDDVGKAGMMLDLLAKALVLLGQHRSLDRLLHHREQHIRCRRASR